MRDTYSSAILATYVNEWVGEMAEVQIQDVSNKHEAILQFMIANPTVMLRDVAAYFKVTQTWLSVIIHSDAFQDKLTTRQDEVFGAITVDIKEQMRAISQVGLDKIAGYVEKSDDKEFVVATTFSVLDKLGYSAKTAVPVMPVNVQNNTFMVTKEDLHAAKSVILSNNGKSDEIKLLPAESPTGI